MPESLPKSCWLKKGSVYTVIKVVKLTRQHMAIAYGLEEIEMPPNCEYKYFLSNRFRPYNEDDALAEKLMEELIEELELENV